MVKVKSKVKFSNCRLIKSRLRKSTCESVYTDSFEIEKISISTGLKATLLYTPALNYSYSRQKIEAVDIYAFT